MTFWEFLWAILKLGIFVYVGVPVIILIILLIFCLFL